MNKLEIVMFNMSSFSEWSKGVVNRNYHVFRELACREEVERIVAVDFLPFSFKRAARNYWENIVHSPDYADRKDVRVEKIYQDLTSRCLRIKGLYPADIYLFSTIDSYFSQERTLNKLNRILDLLPDSGRDTRLLWSYFPVFVKYLEMIPARWKIFDAVDNWLEHPSFVSCRSRLQENYQTLARKADLIFTVAPALVDFFKKMGRIENTFYIPLGVDVEHFQRRERKQPADLVGIPRPIVGYLGTIQSRVDVDLLEYLAAAHPDKSFVLVGPLWPVFLRRFRPPAIAIKRLRKYSNVYLLGRRSYTQTPAYVHNFDVAIIPHYVDQFMKYTGSMKLLEYLACGRPVVATPTSGAENFAPLVYLAESKKDFSEKIDRARQNDTMELKEKRVEKARQYDWSIQIDKMMEIIKSKLSSK